MLYSISSFEVKALSRPLPRTARGAKFCRRIVGFTRLTALRPRVVDSPLPPGPGPMGVEHREVDQLRKRFLVPLVLHPSDFIKTLHAPIIMVFFYAAFHPFSTIILDSSVPI